MLYLDFKKIKVSHRVAKSVPFFKNKFITYITYNFITSLLRLHYFFTFKRINAKNMTLTVSDKVNIVKRLKLCTKSTLVLLF